MKPRQKAKIGGEVREMNRWSISVNRILERHGPGLLAGALWASLLFSAVTLSLLLGVLLNAKETQLQLYEIKQTTAFNDSTTDRANMKRTPIEEFPASNGSSRGFRSFSKTK